MCIDVMHVTGMCQVGDMASYRRVVCCGATGDPITFCHMSSSHASSIDMIGEKFKPREPFFLLSLFSLSSLSWATAAANTSPRLSVVLRPPFSPTFGPRSHRRYLLLTE
jgi:hypothetical protein